jgi:hypothetical protein
MLGKLLLIYMCNFHVFNHLLLIYICKLNSNSSKEKTGVNISPSVVVAVVAVIGKLLLIYICNFHVSGHLLLNYICKLHWNRSSVNPNNIMDSNKVDFLGGRSLGKLLIIYICNFHVLSHLLLIYICKLHWKAVH